MIFLLVKVRASSVVYEKPSSNQITARCTTNTKDQSDCDDAHILPSLHSDGWESSGFTDERHAGVDISICLKDFVQNNMIYIRFGFMV